MAIRTKNEILEQIKARFGEASDDETISFLEDISDTYDDLETRATGDGIDWQARYNENDEQWRKKYTERFYNAETKNEGNTNNEPANPEPDNTPTKFEELFTTD